ncbi:phosphoglucosamine mutase [Bryobacter aggregatus]|uniref:phosphoglucosamine mutase n=1 Tax=Bryobacter aggregatus TaxID=360054 RepID=UPI0004E1F038|nr:phosphoglucosamine mutase [Bryobacter aggregatus]
MARQLFGTDGIRGLAGEAPLDPQTAWALGSALGSWAKGKADSPRVLLGLDTRESGRWLAEAVAAGLAAAGVEAHFAGLLTTPGVAYNTKHGPYVAGVMISASHNPYQDNGLKVFDHSGYKLPDEQELVLEQEILRLREGATVPPFELPWHGELADHYLEFLRGSFGHSLHGLKIAIDCAHGAATPLAPRLFGELGAELIVIGNEPTGRNINDGVGALHPDAVRAVVLREGADLGIAFDGDADRAMFISSSGALVDGDAVLLIAARLLKSRNRLPGDCVVSTVMSNLGLEVALQREGIALVRTGVGDKYVLEEMIRSGNTLGGEQSGHVIFSQYSTTGDGMLTALRVLEAMVESGKSLDELRRGFEVYPQMLVNVKIQERQPLENLPEVQARIAECEQAFGGDGRVLVRFSGTEPLARVMVEGNDLAKVTHHAHTIAASLASAIGVK